jgi:hypothetical protein
MNDELTELCSALPRPHFSAVHHSSFIISHFPCASAIFTAQTMRAYLALLVSFHN